MLKDKEKWDTSHCRDLRLELLSPKNWPWRKKNIAKLCLPIPAPKAGSEGYQVYHSQWYWKPLRDPGGGGQNGCTISIPSLPGYLQVQPMPSQYWTLAWIQTEKDLDNHLHPELSAAEPQCHLHFPNKGRMKMGWKLSEYNGILRSGWFTSSFRVGRIISSCKQAVTTSWTHLQATSQEASTLKSESKKQMAKLQPQDLFHFHATNRFKLLPNNRA